MAVAPVVAADSATTKASEDNSIEAVIDPLTQFVAAMNAEAARPGMTKTQFSNPHGLSQRHSSLDGERPCRSGSNSFEERFVYALRFNSSTRRDGYGTGRLFAKCHLEEHPSIARH